MVSRWSEPKGKEVSKKYYRLAQEGQDTLAGLKGLWEVFSRLGSLHLLTTSPSSSMRYKMGYSVPSFRRNMPPLFSPGRWTGFWDMGRTGRTEARRGMPSEETCRRFSPSAR